MIEALAQTYPNDADLGREIRKMCKDYNEHVEHIYNELDEAFDVTKYFPNNIKKTKCNWFHTYDDYMDDQERLCANCGQGESKH